MVCDIYAHGSYSTLTKVEKEDLCGLGQLKVFGNAMNKVSFVHKVKAGVGKVSKLPRVVRTISSMGQHVLEVLTSVEKENAQHSVQQHVPLSWGAFLLGN